MELGELYTHFHSSLLQYVKSKIRSKEDAEDVLQNIFTKIARDGVQVSPKENIKSWLFIITRNAVYDYYRKSKKQQVLKVKNDEEIVHNLLVNNFPNYEDLDTTKGMDQCLQSFIGLLPERYKQVVKEYELEGISQKKLAEKYSMPYSSLRTRVQRGRAQLKEMLTDCCRIELDRRGNILEAIPKKPCSEDSCSSCS